METTTPNISLSTPSVEEEGLSIKSLFLLFLRQWRWFVLSVLVCLSLGVLYLLRTPNVYTRSASILIKEDTKGGNSMSIGGELQDLGIFKSNTNINNELLTITSPTLMTEVVRRLGLNETYSVRDRLRTRELYKSSPVMLIYTPYPDSSIKALNGITSERPVSFRITLKSKEEYLLSHFTLGEEEYDGTVTCKVGERVETPVGNVLLSLTSWFEERYIGEAIYYHRGTYYGTSSKYAGALTAQLGNKEATIINLSISDVSIRKADDIINTLISVYNENWIQDKNQIAISTSQFINERLNVIEKELGNVDENISSYQSEHLLPDVDAASNLYLQQSAANRQALLDLNTQLSLARYIKEELSRADISQPLPGNSGIDNQGIERQIEEYNTIALERNRFIANSSETNPLVVDMSATLSAMKKSIMQSVDNYIMTVNTQIESVRSEEEKTISRLASNPTQAKYLLSVGREQKVKESLYLYLLQKREENELSQAFTAYNTRVITPPQGSPVPTEPKKLIIIILALFIGMMVPAVILFLRDNMDSKVRGRSDIKSMRLPLLGEIPLYQNVGTIKRSRARLLHLMETLHIRKHKKGDNTLSLVVEEGNRNVINEAFRVMRSNLDFMTGNDHDHNKVIVVTSFNPGSGKSFITMNMAKSIAIKGKRVLVIDGDLRHGTASTFVHSPKSGMSDYLCSRVDDYHNVIVASESNPNLHVIPIGTVPPNPTELLEGERLSSLVSNVRKEYDYIFIDCPPIDIVADTQIIEQLSDRTIFIVRVGLLERNMLSELDRIYDRKRFKNMSMVLNGTSVHDGRYGSGYGYRYGYHYGYHGTSYYQK